MPPKVVTPELGAKSFSCSYCGAISHQNWYRIFAHDYEKKEHGPFMPIGIPLEAPQKIQELCRKLVSRQIFLETHKQGSYSSGELMNLYVSRCYSCEQWAVWIGDSLIYPTHNYEIEPTADMPLVVRADFVEAATIIDQSPRGAAALLRLCLQKLMKELGETGSDLNADIGNLVKKGLDVGIQRALDLVRVIGNNSVHPGQIEMTDNRAMAIQIFDLVNLIVEDRITKQNKIKALYETLPATALEAIKKRDSDGSKR